jgi:UDP-N-acetylmuramate--alanine ligase
MKPELGRALPAHIGAIHFIGVGGSGMSGIARVFAERGHPVSGSDRADSEVIQSLRGSGITIFLGHERSHVEGADTVVFSSAVRESNPEYQEAVERGLTIIHRSEALRWLLQGFQPLAIAGSHGKTTTTAMVATSLEAAGIDAGCVNGGVVSQWGVSSRDGSDSLFVIEADESDRSFVGYQPSHVLITNIAPDHLDFYGTLDAIYEAFEAFARTAQNSIVLCADDVGTRELATRLNGAAPVVTYGVSPDADVVMSNVVAGPRASFQLSYRGQSTSVTLSVPGRLPALNSAGVVALLLGLGLGLEEAGHAVSGFQGADRRFQHHGTLSGVRFYDDHAHHPTEVAAALETARAVVGEGKIITLFQPHLFSRTQYMAQELAAAFVEGSDHTIFLDIFGSREDPIDGVTTQLILDQLPEGTSYDFEPDWDRACALAVSRAQPGDLVLTMSTGDLYQIVPQLLEAKRVHDQVKDG